MDAAPLVAVVGAGMAGLVAAVAAREAGAHVVVLEQADEPGGAAAWSSGWLWRYRDLRSWRTFAPHGDEGVQSLVDSSLDADLEWLDSLGALLVERDTGRPHTVGARIDPARLVDALTARLEAGALRTTTALSALQVDRSGGGWQLELAERLGHLSVDTRSSQLRADAVVLAGGGYSADILRIAQEGAAPVQATEHWMQRSPCRSDGAPLKAAAQVGGLRSPATGECAARLVPAGLVPRRGTAAQRAIQPGAGGELVDARGRALAREGHDWAGAQLAWQLARTTGDGWYLVGAEALERAGGDGSLAAMLRDVERDGAEVLHVPGDQMQARLEALLDAPLDERARALAAAATVALRVAPGIDATSDGLRVDAHARVLVRPRGPGRRTRPIPGLFAAGADVASTGLGGVASGLAQALVLGRAAGAAAARVRRS